MIKNRYAWEWDFYLVLMYMYLFPWCFFMAKNTYAQEWGFYLVLIYMYLFLWCFIYGLKLLKIVTNWYTWEWVRFFSLGFKNLAQRAAKYTPHRCFLVNFAKFWRKRFLHNTSRRLLLFFCLICKLWNSDLYVIHFILDTLRTWRQILVLQKWCFYLPQGKYFENNEKCCLFYIKSSFRSWDF